MHKRPLAVISVFFILGIILGRFLPDSVRLFYVFVATLIFILLCLILALISCRGGFKTCTCGSENSAQSLARSSLKLAPLLHIFLFLSIISLGSLLYLNSNIFPPNHISQFLGKDKVKAEIAGIIKSPAEARGVYYGKVSSRYIFEIESIDSLKISGLALIRIQTEKDYQYGDRLIVKGTVKKPAEISNYKFQNPNKFQISNSKYNKKTNFDYKRYLENQNIFAIINASEKNVALLKHSYKVNPVIRFAYIVREKLKNIFLEKMPLESGAFLRAILLGDRSELPKKLNESFRNSGTMHIIAISGLNVSLIAMAILFLFRFLRVKREISYIFTIIFLSFLAILTGGTASVVRATVMCVVFLVGMLLGRGIDIYNSLGAAGLFILIKDPKDIFDVGFQLSFLAVLSMVYFTPKLMQVVPKDMNFYIKKYLFIPLAVSISASLGTFWLIMYYFRIITPIAIAANLFIVPAMFILMIGGLGFLALGWVPFAGGILAGFNNIMAQVIFFLAGFFGGVKFGHFYM